MISVSKLNTVQAEPAIAFTVRYEMNRRRVVEALLVYEQYIGKLSKIEGTQYVKECVRSVLERYGSNYAKLPIEDSVYVKKVDIEYELDYIRLRLFKA